MAIEKAKRMGVGLALVRNSSHFGAMWDYVEMALKYDMIGWATSVCDPSVAPPGGAARVIGTNPMAVAIPAGKYNPIVLDCATSTSSVGKLKVYAAKGQRIPEGWIVDKEGKPTTDPNDFFHGGTLLSRGGYYGFAFSLIAEAFAGVLSGFGCRPSNNSQGGFFEAIDISHFMPVNQFKAVIDEHISVIKSSPKAPGVIEITLPGEPELRTKEKRLREGIPIPDSTWGELIKLGQDVGVDVKKIALGTWDAYLLS
jgi:LDH2 family malate/lactate/ureidoglycolate dehydrogenase